MMTNEEKIKDLERQIAELKAIPTKEERLWQLLLQTNSIKIDKDTFPNSTFGFKDDIFLWEYNSKNGCLWLNYYFIWFVFEEEYSMNYEDIQSFIKEQVEAYFNCKEITPRSLLKASCSKVEAHFNCKEITP